jgi:hypothetical protein
LKGCKITERLRIFREKYGTSDENHQFLTEVEYNSKPFQAAKSQNINVERVGMRHRLSIHLIGYCIMDNNKIY